MFFSSKYGEIFYDVSGPKDKPLIAFCHGVGMDHRTFEQQVKALSQDYQVLVWDMPGHGKSTLNEDNRSYSKIAADCLIELLDEIQVKEAMFAGLSLGSFVVQQIMNKYPQRVLATIHVGGICLYPAYSKMLKPAFPLIVGMCKLMPSGFFYSSFGKHRSVSKETQSYMKETITKAGKKLVLRITGDMGKDMIEGVQKPPQKPMLIIYGQKDFYTRKSSKAWHKRMPWSQLAVIANAHHITNQDNPEALNKALLSFLDGVK